MSRPRRVETFRTHCHGIPAIQDVHAVGPILDLTGLEYATNLTKLTLNGNPITDLTPLAGLTNLTELDLRVNEIADVTPLAGLTNLTNLQVGWNYIADVSPLVNLTNLTKLYLKNCQITDDQQRILTEAIQNCDLYF